MLPKTDAAKYADTNNNTTLLPNGKLRFDQTGMEFPPSVTRAVLEAYANGKAFRRSIARRENEAYDFSVHQPYIVPHKDRDEHHFLYCTLTKATLPRDRTIVQNHVNAKRFRRRLQEIEERKKKQEDLAENQRDKRAKAAAAKKPHDENKERKSSEEATGEQDEPMEEDDGNDVLDGIISDDEESIESSEEANASQKTANHTDGASNGREQQENQNDKMEEDEVKADDKDIFWIRGRRGAARNKDDDDDDDDDDDEWGEPAEKKVRRSRRKKKSSGTESTGGTPLTSTGDSRMQETVTGKRSRVTVQVPKKVRQARQRRKTRQ